METWWKKQSRRGHQKQSQGQERGRQRQRGEPRPEAAGADWKRNVPNGSQSRICAPPENAI